MLVEASTANDSYVLRLPAEVGTTATGLNAIKITVETVQTVDDLDFHEVDKLYMMRMINKLERLAMTSAEGVNNNGHKDQDN